MNGEDLIKILEHYNNSGTYSITSSYKRRLKKPVMLSFSIDNKIENAGDIDFFDPEFIEDLSKTRPEIKGAQYFKDTRIYTFSYINGEDHCTVVIGDINPCEMDFCYEICTDFIIVIDLIIHKDTHEQKGVYIRDDVNRLVGRYHDYITQHAHIDDSAYYIVNIAHCESGLPADIRNNNFRIGFGPAITNLKHDIVYLSLENEYLISLIYCGHSPEKHTIEERYYELTRKATPEHYDILISQSKGNKCKGADIDDAYLQAMIALRYTYTYNKSNFVSDFADLGFISDLCTNDPQNLINRAHKTLDPLKIYDDSKGSSLYETLRELVNQGFNISAAGRNLGVQTSTMYHRIAKIEETLGFSLHDTEGNVQLTLAAKAMDTFDGYPNW